MRDDSEKLSAWKQAGEYLGHVPDTHDRALVGGFFGLCILALLGLIVSMHLTDWWDEPYKQEAGLTLRRTAMEKEMTVDEFCAYMTLMLEKFKEQVEIDRLQDPRLKDDWLESFGSFEEYRGE